MKVVLARIAGALLGDGLGDVASLLGDRKPDAARQAHLDDSFDRWFDHDDQTRDWFGYDHD